MVASLTDRLAFGLERAGAATATTVQAATYAAARLLAEPADGTVMAVPGRDTTGDGYGGFFYWDSSSTTADDNADVIKITAVTTGRWKRLAAALSGSQTFSALTISGLTASRYVVTDASKVLTSQLGVPLADLLNSGGATGDVLYWNGTAWTRLAAGTSGYVLTAAGAGVAPAWAVSGSSTAGYASMYCDADTTDFGASAAFVDVTGWGGQNCTASNCTVSTANGTVTVTNAGTYRVTFTGVQVISDGSGSVADVAVQIVKDGTLVPGARRVTNDVPTDGITGSEVAFAINELVTATAGQVFKTQVYCGTQGGGGTTVQIPYANFTVERVA